MTTKRMVSIPGSVPVHLLNADEMGRPDDTQVLTVTVVLRPTEPPSHLANKVKDIETLLPLLRPTLTPDEIEALHSADKDRVDRVKQWAAEQGLEVFDKSRIRHQLVLEGTVQQLNEAFGVELKYFEHPGGRYHAHSGDVQVPEALGECVSAVIGLDNIPRSEAKLATTVRSLEIDESAVPRRTGANAVRDFVERQYNFPVDELDGAGERIAIISFGGGYHQEDLTNYFAALKHHPQVRAISVWPTKSGPGPECHPYPMKKLGVFIDALNNPTLTFEDVSKEVDCAHCFRRAWATVETTMDIEIVGAIAPRAEIDVYFAEDNKTGWFDAVRAALAEHEWTQPRLGEDDLPSVISCSWGWGLEAVASTLMDPLDKVFQIARSKQVTVCCASGDLGSVGTDEQRPEAKLANLNYPASDPYVLSCGGTTVDEDGIETVWNSPFKGKRMATGGGVSGYFMRPDYQDTMDEPAHKDLKPTWLAEYYKVNREWFRGRGVPDVAASAGQSGGYQLLVGGRPFIGGGTSAATPLWAGLIALINQRLTQIARTRVTLGFMNRVFYTVPKVRKTFRSIDSGDNLLDPTNNALASFMARPGQWDGCTGLGVPDGRALLKVLSQ